MFIFEKYRFDDAEISKVIAAGNELRVTYSDWREQECTLIFTRAAGYQWFSPEGRALSHGSVEAEDPFIAGL